MIRSYFNIELPKIWKETHKFVFVFVLCVYTVHCKVLKYMCLTGVTFALPKLKTNKWEKKKKKMLTSPKSILLWQKKTHKKYVLFLHFHPHTEKQTRNDIYSYVRFKFKRTQFVFEYIYTFKKKLIIVSVLVLFVFSFFKA